MVDGTFGYRATTGYNGDYSFTSHSHGWSTGPTHALTTYVVGLAVTAPAGTKWELKPQFGDLKSAEGGFTTPLGKFSSGWALDGDGGFEMWWDVPAGTKGTVVFPESEKRDVIVDGMVWVLRDGEYDETTKMVSLQVEGGGGRHLLKVGS